MTPRKMLCLLLLVAPCLHAQPPGRTQFISDDITLAVREEPRSTGGSVATVRSGARVVTLESLGPESFTRVRLDDGREGWVPTRFLSDEPAARQRLDDVRAELAAAQERGERLQAEVTAMSARLEAAAPALQLATDNERLRAAVKRYEDALEQSQHSFDAASSERRTLITGAALLGLGIVAGLVLPLFAAGRRRRRNEF